ncbi:CD44 antigen isoform X3 [Tyto alba]|uniref:CD44 antigen isoform X3 n=1 Tax=Tyto alba TaxID=56313 RepID=UPI0014021D03|nr:CD44 antigen isoform X3 [Tyto alba]
MAIFSLWATFGLCLLKLCLTETQFNVSCRYGGVFHVEKNGRYSLTRSEAVELCKALNSTLSTLEQLKKAHELGFETCRYGFVVGNIVIPRINPYHLCAANHTGIYKLSTNTTGRYDAYCYNATETRDKACEPVERLNSSFLDNHDEIVIDNADGSRYNADGTRHSGESSTSGADDENVGSGSTHDTTPMDTSIRRSSPSYYGSATPVSQLPDHSSGGGEKEIPRKDSDDEVSPVAPDMSLVTAADDFPEKDGGHYPASTTGHSADVTSSGNGSDDEDSSEETIYTTVFPGWDRSVAKDEYAPITTAVDSQHGTLLELSTQDHWNPAYTDEEEQYPSSAALVTSENEKRRGPTQHPLLHSVHSWWMSQEQNPAYTTGNIEQHEFTVAGENYIEKESSQTAMASNRGAKQNDTAQDPLVYPGWDKGEDYATQPAITDRIIPSRENNHEKDSSSTADLIIMVTVIAFPDGAHHEDPTQPPLPSESEPGQGNEGITHPTDSPGGEVLHRATLSTSNAGDDSPLTSTITESVDDVNREKATKEPLAAGNPPGSKSEKANTTEGSHVSWIPGVFPDIEDRLNQLQTPLPTRPTSSIYGDQGPHKGHYESTTFPGETTTTKVVSQLRLAQVPEWLIIVAALVALALILAVCIAVNSRRRCGQKKKLVINNGKGAVEDRKTSRLNGDASKSQEMVNLVHKEQSNDQTGACDEFLTVNETQNHQDLDMKSGV